MFSYKVANYNFFKVTLESIIQKDFKYFLTGYAVKNYLDAAGLNTHD